MFLAAKEDLCLFVKRKLDPRFLGLQSGYSSRHYHRIGEVELGLG